MANAREEEEAERLKHITTQWGGVLRALGGANDTVEGICRECSFEIRNGKPVHAPTCSQYTYR